MAFPPSILLHPSFSSPRTILGGCCSGSRRSGGGMHPATSDALDFVPVKSKNRSSHSTSQGRVWKRPAASRSPGPQADSGPMEQDKSGWSGCRPGPILQALLDSSRRLSCPHSKPNQSYFAPRGDNSSRPLPNQALK